MVEGRSEQDAGGWARRRGAGPGRSRPPPQEMQLAPPCIAEAAARRAHAGRDTRGRAQVGDLSTSLDATPLRSGLAQTPLPPLHIPAKAAGEGVHG